jgi:hypothetical protein
MCFRGCALSLEVAGSGWAGMTIGGTLPKPSRRLSSGAEVAGAVFVAVGSALLLASTKGMSWLAVVLSLTAAAIVIYAVMTFRLREHMRLTGGSQRRRRLSSRSHRRSTESFASCGFVLRALATGCSISDPATWLSFSTLSRRTPALCRCVTVRRPRGAWPIFGRRWTRSAVVLRGRLAGMLRRSRSEADRLIMRDKM